MLAQTDTTGFIICYVEDDKVYPVISQKGKVMQYQSKPIAEIDYEDMGVKNFKEMTELFKSKLNKAT